jgi:hypothetical protein
VTNCGQIFPLTTRYPFGFSVERPMIVHRFGSLDRQAGAAVLRRDWPAPVSVQAPESELDRNQPAQGVLGVDAGAVAGLHLHRTVPNPDGTTIGVLATFEQSPISFEYLRNAVQVGLDFIEVVDPTQAPSYTVNSTCLRFPSTALSTVLPSEVQQTCSAGPHPRARGRRRGASRWAASYTSRA